jgi:hypothetical protein
MRVTIAALGLELDITFGPETDDTADDDPGAALNGGTLGSTPVGYAPSYGDQRWQPGADHGAGDPEDRRR